MRCGSTRRSAPDASSAFLPAGRVDRRCPPSGLRALRPRADRHDRDASFPFDDYADLRAEMTGFTDPLEEVGQLLWKDQNQPNALHFVMAALNHLVCTSITYPVAIIEIIRELIIIVK
jgi:hypothetical protein